MSLNQSLFQMGAFAFLFFLVMPVGGGLLLYGGFRLGRVNVPLPSCLRAFFVAAGLACLAMIFCNGLLPAASPLGRVLLAGVAVSTLEMLWFAVDLRQLTPRALLIQLAAVLLTNLVGYSIVLLVTMNSPRVIVPGR